MQKFPPDPKLIHQHTDWGSSLKELMYLLPQTSLFFLQFFWKITLDLGNAAISNICWLDKKCGQQNLFEDLAALQRAYNL